MESFKSRKVEEAHDRRGLAFEFARGYVHMSMLQQAPGLHTVCGATMILPWRDSFHSSRFEPKRFENISHVNFVLYIFCFSKVARSVAACRGPELIHSECSYDT